MSVLIGMAVYSTAENKKDECLERTLESLYKTVNFDVHKLRLSVNGYTLTTLNIIERYQNLGVVDFVFMNPENLGTAEAINKVWKMRMKGQHVIKCDDDFIVHSSGWVDELVEAVSVCPKIGQIGLKRRDCIETPYHDDPYFRSELIQLPHEPGHNWIIVEKAKHVMGTCVLHTSDLIDKVGFLRQPHLYGYDDVLMSARSRGAGFINCFLPHIKIDHIDDGKTPYQTWKERHAGQYISLVNELMTKYLKGEDIYYNPFSNE